MKNLNKKEQNLTSMKKAVIDQIILWIALFVVFVSVLFFVIEYSNAIKVKDNTDAIADYAARMVALNRTETEIINGINQNIKDDFFNDVTGISTCTAFLGVQDSAPDTSQPENYQVIVNVRTTLDNDFLTTNDIHSRTVVFNETSAYQIECDINITIGK